MGGSTHVVIGAASAVLVINPQNTQDILLYTGIGAIGGLVADIDTDNSKISHTLRGILLSIALIFGIIYKTNKTFAIELFHSLHNILGNTDSRYIYAVAAMMFLLLVGTFTKHRRFTHSLEYAALFAGATFFLNPRFVLPVFASMVSHILLDILNYKIVMVSILFRIKISLKLCKSNGFIDWLMTMFGGVIYGIVVKLIK